jgi:uncharacterized protein YqeY
MSLKDQLSQDLKDAMRHGDELKKNTIRYLRSAIKNVEIDAGHELSDQDVIAVLVKQAKQRRDSIEQFQQGNRPDLADIEAKELAIIESYLPQPLSDEEIKTRARAVIAELGVTDIKGMGQVMGKLTQELQGVADGKRISTSRSQLRWQPLLTQRTA